MSIQCCGAESLDHNGNDSRFRRMLWLALAINATMFVVEVIAGLAAGSVSLQADALNFLADAANYGISLGVVGMALRYRALAALLKGASMGLFGLWVIGATVWYAVNSVLHEASIMGAVGLAAFLANAAVLAMLWACREGDSNMRSI